MRSTGKFACGRLFLGTLAAGLIVFCLTPGLVQAQVGSGSKGNNAVYGNTGTQIIASTAFVDASAYDTSGTDDFCLKLQKALASITKGGTVIDARGITTNLTCSSTTPINPWAGVSQPTTVLLPAGTITISETWLLPSQSHVFGEGAGQTTVKAASGFATPMIQMGGSGGPCGSGNICFGIQVGHLTLDGGGQQIDGIDNSYSQEQSFVDDVVLQGLEGNGLSIGSGAGHSGPYTNIVFDCSTECSSSLPGTCINILSEEPRGIHGLTCKGSNGSNAAILLDGSDVSLEDVTISGFAEGIEIGSRSSADSNLLLNINGSTSSSLISISNSSTVNNLTILGVTNTNSGTTTISDMLTGTTLSDATIGMYALGHPIGATSGAYTRFTTSPNETTWGIGSATISSTTATCTKNGSLFSSTSTTTTVGTLWACVGGHWTKIK